jgi:signal transduction histidine kinase/ActR/RegA family two-component response regulator
MQAQNAPFLLPGAGADASPDHTVQFYEGDAFLYDAVAGFLAEGLAVGDPAVIIARASSYDGFRGRLNAQGLDIESARRAGRVTVLDAEETLSLIMSGAMPDPERFKAHIGGAIEQSCGGWPAAGQRPKVWAYGEMVDVLWGDGNPKGAVRLEELWNDLARTHSFSLLCAYRMTRFSNQAHIHDFDEVCRQHARVVPTERWTPVEADSNRLREITVLHQRAVALETEIEARKALEAERGRLLTLEREARTEAEQANRLKDEFLAVLSHELRTPLNAILGWLQIVRDRRTDKATLSRALEVIGRNAALQQHLIDDLLDVSCIASGKMQISADPVDLAGVIEAAIDSVRPAATAKTIEVDIRVDESAGIVTGDAGRLQQVVWNLLSNAIKFTPKGGRVEVGLERSGSETQIIVRDTGQGIAPEFLPYVFDRFRQADTGTTRIQGGLGLGLAVARYLIEAHGGTVSAESAGIGHGSTFRVRLPLRAAAADVVIGHALPDSAVALEGARVLVVDDNQDARELLRYVLEHLGATVESATTAQDAVRAASVRPFDVVLADIGLPGRDGCELIAEIRDLPAPHANRLRAVAVTAYAGDHHRARAIAAGYDAYLTKPIDPAVLARTISALLARRAKEPAA